MSTQYRSFIYKCVAIGFLLLGSSREVHADLVIFDVRKNLPMSNSDTVYRDFYITGGSESGLSVGMILTVQRRIPLYDNYQNRSAGDLNLKVAKIKIIHVQRGLSVGRLHVEFTREGSPLLEDPFIMIGDRIDLGSASSDKKADNSGSSEGEHSKAPTIVAPAPSPAPAPAPAPAATPTPAALVSKESRDTTNQPATEKPTPQTPDAPPAQSPPQSQIPQLEPAPAATEESIPANAPVASAQIFVNQVSVGP